MFPVRHKYSLNWLYLYIDKYKRQQGCSIWKSQCRAYMSNVGINSSRTNEWQYVWATKWLLFSSPSKSHIRISLVVHHNQTRKGKEYAAQPRQGDTLQSHHCCCLVAQSCPTLCDSTGCSLPGSSVHEVLQSRILEWVATWRGHL